MHASQRDANNAAQGCESDELPWVRRAVDPNSERVAALRVTPHSPAMPQSLAKILLHVVFSTKERRPYLRDRDLRGELHRYLGGILGGLDCQPLLIGGVEDHVHILCVLARTCTPAEMIKELKRSSSIWIKNRGADLDEFAWQNGYGIFSIGLFTTQ